MLLPIRSRHRLTRVAAVTAVLALGPVAAGASAAQRTDLRSSPRAYWSWIGTTLAPVIGTTGRGGPGGSPPQAPKTAAAQLDGAISYTRDLGRRFAQVRPPRHFAAAHADYRQALALQLKTFREARGRTTANAPFEDYFDALYGVADSSYAFVAESDAKCELNDAADSWGYATYDFQRFCRPTPRPGRSVGSSASPVNRVTIVLDEYGDGTTLPNLWYPITRITASSKRPIALTFDNRNTAPFLFNLAIYRGTPADLTGHRPIAVTHAGSGPEVQHLTVRLAPGTYTYTDNVHAYSVRGVLEVV